MENRGCPKPLSVIIPLQSCLSWPLFQEPLGLSTIQQQRSSTRHCTAARDPAPLHRLLPFLGESCQVNITPVKDGDTVNHGGCQRRSQFQ